MKRIKQIYELIQKIKLIVDIAIPVLEKFLNKDLNNNDVIGE